MVISRCFRFLVNDTVLFFTAEQNPTVSIYHLFLLHASVDRHLCFSDSALVSSTAVNMWECLPDKCSEAVRPGQMVDLCC